LSKITLLVGLQKEFDKFNKGSVGKMDALKRDNA